jgi:hypothetical protein
MIYCPKPKWALGIELRVELRVSTLIIIHLDISTGALNGCEAGPLPTISKLLPVANPDTGWKPMMLHYTVAWSL